MKREMECDRIHVFTRCVLASGLAMERRRLLMAPTDSLEDARAAYVDARGRPVRQDHFRDEHGFVLQPGLSKQSLARFSNQCRLNLDLCYKDGAAVSMMQGTIDAPSNVWAWAKRKLVG